MTHDHARDLMLIASDGVDEQAVDAARQLLRSTLIDGCMTARAFLNLLLLDPETEQIVMEAAKQ